MSTLYEKFLLNYFKNEHPDIFAHTPQIDWQIDEGIYFFLPKMKTEVTLEYCKNILIIDAKFYSQNTSENYGNNHTSNLYQIFTYVKNKAFELEGTDIDVSGMLLYTRTSESIQPDSDYVMSGNKINVNS